jgi:undecaprenyl-diphosphatase
MDDLIELDKKLFLELNGLHAPWLDTPVKLMSETLVWIPLYVVLLYFIYKQFGADSWIVLIGLTLTIILADQMASTIMKPYFARLRPTHDPQISALVHVVDNYRGRSFGFASSHAANTFGAAMFIYLFLHRARRGIFVLFFWAAVVTYTRIYLGVHYPGDLLAGAVVGTLCATGCYYLTRYSLSRWQLRKGSATS